MRRGDAARSKDPSTQIGAVIVGQNREILSTGYNGFPRGMDDAPEKYLDREFKLRHAVHAELNAILNAARNGTAITGASIYVTHPPCQQCASALIQAGIATAIFPVPDPAFAERYHFADTLALLEQCGVAVILKD